MLLSHVMHAIVAHFVVIEGTFGKYLPTPGIGARCGKSLNSMQQTA